MAYRYTHIPGIVKNPSAMQETWVRSLVWEGLLEAGMATHSSILAWRNSWTEEPGGLQSMGSQRVWQTERLSTAPWSHNTAEAGGGVGRK